MNRSPRSIATGLALRCPACGRGRIFAERSGRMFDRCEACGVAFERSRGEFTGAVMLFMGLSGFLALMGWFVLEVFTDAPAWFKWGWLGFFALVFPIGFYRNFKGAWIGLVHWGAGLGHEQVDPLSRTGR